MRPLARIRHMRGAKVAWRSKGGMEKALCNRNGYDWGCELLQPFARRRAMATKRMVKICEKLLFVACPVVLGCRRRSYGKRHVTNTRTYQHGRQHDNFDQYARPSCATLRTSFRQRGAVVGHDSRLYLISSPLEPDGRAPTIQRYCVPMHAHLDIHHGEPVHNLVRRGRRTRQMSQWSLHPVVNINVFRARSWVVQLLRFCHDSTTYLQG